MNLDEIINSMTPEVYQLYPPPLSWVSGRMAWR